MYWTCCNCVREWANECMLFVLSVFDCMSRIIEEDTRQCCMRNWFACVYHSTQFELSEKRTALHVYSNFIWNWWPQFNRRVLCLYCRRRPPSSTLTLTITYLLTATLFHFVRVLSFSRALPNGTTAKIIFHWLHRLASIVSLYEFSVCVCMSECEWECCTHTLLCVYIFISRFSCIDLVSAKIARETKTSQVNSLFCFPS